MLDQLLDDFRQQHQPPTDHPDFEVLSQFALYELAAPPNPPLIEHLDQCRSCADLVLALRQEQMGLQKPALAQEHAWLRFQDRLESPVPDLPEPDPLPQPPVLPIVAPAIWARARFAYAIAAVLALALLVQTLKPRPGLELTANLQNLSLLPLSENNTSRSITKQLTGQTTGHLLLQLTTTNLHSYPGYEVVIQAASGKKWTTQLARGSDGAFMLLIPAGTLGRGTYQVNTFGLDQGIRDPLDQYELQLEDP